MVVHYDYKGVGGSRASGVVCPTIVPCFDVDVVLILKSLKFGEVVVVVFW